MKKAVTQRLRKPEFPFFPHSIFRPNPSFLDSSNLSKDAVDPWARRDDWRYDDFFSPKNRLKAAFPGIGLGLGALGLYISYDLWYTYRGPGKEEAEIWNEWLKKRNLEKGVYNHQHDKSHKHY